ncbi:MAG TPA: glycosyl hydrolase [Longimicrobiales bacterium]|nr:glycosyl hydrolase [Longimicrobiales bacterium]
MRAGRLARLSLPLLVIAALAFTYPWFGRAFDTAVSTVRLRVGQLGTELGLVPETRGLMLGIYRPEVPYSMGRMEAMERAIGKPFDILSFYQTWGDREQDEFPHRLMRNAIEHGAMAMVTWEPWTTEFDRNRGRTAGRARTDLREIADGAYDAYIREWAREAAIHGQVFLLRFAHEANNPQYPWSIQASNRPEDFVAAWRHVWTLFQEAGARNVVWVWSPRGAPPQELYPGGEYVDWIGVGVFNYGAFSAAGGWHSFEYVYDPIYRAALRYERPIVIAELGTVALGGSQADWFDAALDRITTTYPQTKALVLFDNPADQTLPGAVIDWSIEDDAAVLAVFRRHVEEGALRQR